MFIILLIKSILPVSASGKMQKENRKYNIIPIGLYVLPLCTIGYYAFSLIIKRS